MPNGTKGDNPLTDMKFYGRHPFPEDIEAMLREIDALGRASGRYPLGENWPFAAREFHWERGADLDAARRLLSHLLEMLKAGRGDEVLHDPRTGRPFKVEASS